MCKVAHHTLLNYAGLFICPQRDVKFAIIISLGLPVQNFRGIPSMKSLEIPVQLNATLLEKYCTGLGTKGMCTVE